MRFLAERHSLEVLPFLALTYVENTGVSFGLFQNLGNTPFLIINLGFVLVLAIYYLKRQFAFWPNLGFLLLISGGLGNTLDRLFRDVVIDFIDFKIWPVFNLADAMITIGVLIYVSHSFFNRSSHL